MRAKRSPKSARCGSPSRRRPQVRQAPVASIVGLQPPRRTL